MAKDTPGFIANHVAMHGLMQYFRSAGRRAVYRGGDRRHHGRGDRPSEERDVPNGRHRGARHPGARRRRPRGAPAACPRCAVPVSAIRRRDDHAGLDWRESGTGILRTAEERLGESRDLGARSADDGVPAPSARQPAVARGGRLAAARRTGCASSSPGTDRVGEFLQSTLPPALRYAAEVAPDIAHSIDDIDRAMHWGYGWPLGPFELSDAIGLDGKRFRSSPLGPALPRIEILRSARDRQRVVATNAGASLIDLEDGVLAVSLHSKMNAIGGDALDMLQRGVREASAELLGIGRRRGRPEFFGRRQSDAAAPRSAGGQLGGDRRDDPDVPEGNDRPALFGGSGRRRPVRPDAGGWMRNRSPRRPRAGERPKATSDWSKSASD